MASNIVRDNKKNFDMKKDYDLLNSKCKTLCVQKITSSLSKVYVICKHTFYHWVNSYLYK